MSAPGLAVILSRDGSSPYLGSDDGCRIACPQSLPLSRSVNATYKSLIPDFVMPTIPRPLRPTTRTDRWATQAASTNNERATSTATGATPPADVANNATIIIEVIPASHGLFVYWESIRVFEDPLRSREQRQLYLQVLARLCSLVGGSRRSPRIMDLAPVRIHAVEIEEQDRHPSSPRSAGADSIDSSSRYQPPDGTNHSHARRSRAVPDNDHAFIDDTGAELQLEDARVHALLRADIAVYCAFDCYTE